MAKVAKRRAWTKTDVENYGSRRKPKRLLANADNLRRLNGVDSRTLSRARNTRA
jgi:hypothetical protein